MITETISDRHVRAFDGLVEAPEITALNVRILASEAARSCAGQHLIVCLVNLLGRMTDLVGSIQLDVPDAKVIVPMPNAGAPRLHEAVATLVKWAVGDKVRVTADRHSPHPQIQLCIGSDVDADKGATALHALANGWCAWVGTAENLPAGGALEPSDNPLGPFLAATLLAGEVFKRARGIRRGRWISDFGYSLWSGKEGAWPDLLDGPPLSGQPLPPFYLVGAGAVGQGLVNILGAASFASSYVVTIDDDRHDVTNFNRCFLAGIDDENELKTNAVARYRRLTGICGYEFAGTLNDYVRRAKPGLRSDLVSQEADDRFEYVVSCVDKGSSRQDIQGLWPRLIFGGSTLGLSAKANVYDLCTGTPCLGCHNPPEQDGEQLRRVEQQVRGMSPDEQRAFLAGVTDLDAVLSYLAAADRCGTAGEADFRAFATRRSREFSVSFVSMAAAVLLTARLFGRLLFQDAPNAHLPSMTSLAFLNASVQHGSLSIDPECRKCNGDPAAAFLSNSPFGSANDAK